MVSGKVFQVTCFTGTKIQIAAEDAWALTKSFDFNLEEGEISVYFIIILFIMNQ